MTFVQAVQPILPGLQIMRDVVDRAAIGGHALLRGGHALLLFRQSALLGAGHDDACQRSAGDGEQRSAQKSADNGDAFLQFCR